DERPAVQHEYRAIRGRAGERVHVGHVGCRVELDVRRVLMIRALSEPDDARRGDGCERDGESEVPVPLHVWKAPKKFPHLRRNLGAGLLRRRGPQSAGVTLPMRNGCWVGAGEPPAGSSVTAVSSNVRPGGTSMAAIRRPSAAVLNTPRLTGFPLAMAHNWYVRPAGAGGRSKTAMTTRCRDGFQ